jgi:hypothetical protein
MNGDAGAIVELGSTAGHHFCGHSRAMYAYIYIISLILRRLGPVKVLAYDGTEARSVGFGHSVASDIM